MTLSYKDSGVDIQAGDALVDWLQHSETHSPHQDKIIAGIGGFAALFRGKFSGMSSPVLVSCTDGVGTKVKLASHFREFHGVGQDLVAMCVNDLICTGAEPLFFLDYYAAGKLNLEDAKTFIKSVRQACYESDCALIGGETAEMPGVYQEGDFDCAGFAVGVVDESKIIGKQKVKAGDTVIGISSSGFHSNGYSLLRKVFAHDLSKWREVLLTPTHLYVQLARELKNQLDLHALAHITGGGEQNVLRVLPQGLHWRQKNWELPAVFCEVQKRTGMSLVQLKEALNCGLGLVGIVSADSQTQALDIIRKQGFGAYDLGKVEAGGNGETPRILRQE